MKKKQISPESQVKIFFISHQNILSIFTAYVIGKNIIVRLICTDTNNQKQIKKKQSKQINFFNFFQQRIHSNIKKLSIYISFNISIESIIVQRQSPKFRFFVSLQFCSLFLSQISQNTSQKSEQKHFFQIGGQYLYH
ncbi:unnamed protein product [Paramecium sonneborni]|uniref:Transmembrane protein n=1 Tax=Paramecium sonneborni TaxID=65129 RepID=A0A8S1RP79_9CILI|nr:unnamed protein product [Paramecium sonneborni]